MACCALAAFLIGQALLFWSELHARFHRDPLAPMGAAAWRFGDAAPLQPHRKRARLRLGALLATIGAAGLGGGAAYAASQPREVEIENTGIYATICGETTGFSLERLFGGF